MNVVVGGWQRYDNKGRVVEQWEPFFGAGWDYVSGEAAGASARLIYDAAGRVERTIAPDGSESRTVYGIPKNIADPSTFEPSPWESYAYDANDNAGRTPTAPGAANVPVEHRNTPASVEVDCLGRVIKQVARLHDDELVTQTEYDVLGNVVAIIDPVGRRSFEYFYDLANRPLRTESIDAGARRIVLDAAGNLVESRDAKDALTLTTYDALNRPTALWARDDTTSSVTMRQRVEYADVALATDDAKARNLLGKEWKSWDEAGSVELERCDFKGNALETIRRVVSDEVLAATDSWRADWERMDAAVLDAREFRVSPRFDALNRVVE